jgi:L-methionine (R)-S-oxide reductase
VHNLRCVECKGKRVYWDRGRLARTERSQKAGFVMTFTFSNLESLSKTELYSELGTQLGVLFEGESDFIANAANFSSLLYHSLPDVNWVGFYLLKDNELVLGPFQGQPACVRIAMGKGVCGTAAELQQTVVVENVHEFPGHIACDSASNSEIVVPLINQGQLIGVLDLDSPSLSRFNDDDARGLNELAAAMINSSECGALTPL